MVQNAPAIRAVEDAVQFAEGFAVRETVRRCMALQYVNATLENVDRGHVVILRPNPDRPWRYYGGVQRVVTVYFGRDGREWGHVTMADSLYAAVHRAWSWFQSDAWHGPRPSQQTVFRVLLTGDGRQFRVRGSQVIGPIALTEGDVAAGQEV